jgi:hypothetical protein
VKFGRKPRKGKFLFLNHPHPRGELIYEDDDEDEADSPYPGKQ